MSVSEQDQGAPIIPGSPLARMLDDYAVPGLSAGFAGRVLAAAEVRPASWVTIPIWRGPGPMTAWRSTA